VLYLERIPAAPLDRFIRVLWYARVNDAPHKRERVLPGGCVEVILNLARDFLLDCPEGANDHRMPPALIVGARSVYEIIDTSDMADLVGVAFAPGGFAPFASDAVDVFSNRSIDLTDLWGSSVRGLRDRLRELHRPEEKLYCMERFLLSRFVPRILQPAPGRTREVTFALQQFDQAPGIATVREVARQTGWSDRRFSQVFREAVGLSPKVWCRVQRFQKTVQQLHAGRDVRWAELALDCGYYDQAHFANEFRAFSGIDATTYSARHQGPWANHLPAE
jgi:AraC-like DNA-binding protein